MEQAKLQEILEEHKKWLASGGSDGRRANLYGANLYRASLYGADLRRANLSGANLYGADLSGALNIPFTPMACPDSGAFIAWKKARISGGADVIVKLLIPQDARRSSATGRKCRCDKAIVLAIETLEGEAAEGPAVSRRDANFLYQTGKTVRAENFDENRYEECAPGIHFFINRQEAVDFA